MAVMSVWLVSCSTHVLPRVYTVHQKINTISTEMWTTLTVYLNLAANLTKPSHEPACVCMCVKLD